MTDVLPAPTDAEASPSSPTTDEGDLAEADLPPLSDSELEAQALAAERCDVADDDAVSYWEFADHQDLGLLPAWYMPGPSAGARRLVGWKRRLAWVLIGTFLSIDAAGLCFTYGRIEGWGFVS